MRVNRLIILTIAIVAIGLSYSCYKNRETDTFDQAIAHNLNNRLQDFILKGGSIPPSATTAEVIDAVNSGVAKDGIIIPSDYNPKTPMTITNRKLMIYDHATKSFIYK